MEYFYFILVFIFGLCLGSFLNAWMWRIRENISISKGRSMCVHCRHELYWYDNIPILSFIFLRGKCRFCKERISWQYPLVEFLVALLFAFVFYVHGGSVVFDWKEIIRDWSIIFFLVFIFVYDFKYQLILDRATLPISIVLFLLNILFGWQTWYSILIGVVVGAGFFLLQYIVSAGKWIGGGDIRLGLFMGVVLGWPNIIVGLGLSYVVGAICSLVLVGMKKKQMANETPFGTYLTFGTFVAMFWGDKIVRWYISLLK